MKKEEKVKIYNNFFKIVFIILSVSFITLYISNSTGYFEYHQRQKAVLTEENIKKFEEDVKNGINLDLETYLESTKKNYNNKTSSFGLFLSYKIEEYSKKWIEATFEILSELLGE